MSSDEEVTVTVHLQAWVREQPYEVDDSPVEFTVPRQDATDDEGNLLPDDTHASDKLKQHENAPTRVQNWQGPYYVEVDEA
jgi:hypothetical protein